MTPRFVGWRLRANIGYGLRTITYADGRTREFYQIGLSANTSGISVYIMGLGRVLRCV